ncbi:TioE family transcriptional regulator [Labedaea rhizosphaerae]|uniref:DNA-binding transcriptional MerR regulator n=1 Tax=Labedaea rhizosphaerae TaxID=598644 RepID=A0A4R6S9X8_LABRH|nr:TioE family transcriptional regulator [Labedaea rhizosphaerae]TDP96284.1 DNA-binding transcriptional MerR regulator [Labedaea rhizosphaerae]
MSTLRPADLAREHGISTQAVRNYERDGFLPPAARSASGYRTYTDVHAAALRAFLALIPAYGHAGAGRIMLAANEGQLDQALLLIDRAHAQLLRDRETLATVRKAVGPLTSEAAELAAPASTRTIGELARWLGVTPATVRNWERAGILVPDRHKGTGYRVYQPSDLRDAELTRLLRRGGYPLDHIRTVVEQVRTAGGTEALAGALDDWQQRLTTQGLAMLDAAARLGEYLRLRGVG